VFFFSSGAVEEGWSRADLVTNRLNVYIGFPLGGLLSLTLMAGATLFLEPRRPASPSRSSSGSRARWS
jgi:manganese transport protein